MKSFLRVALLLTVFSCYASETIYHCSSPLAKGISQGQKITVDCNGCSTSGGVWGTTWYTSDSSICAAALHDGKLQRTKLLVIEGFPTKGIGFVGLTKNGVTSKWYGHYPNAFIFPSALNAGGCSMSAKNIKKGEKMVIDCSGCSTSGDVWGSVHAYGSLTAEENFETIGLDFMSHLKTFGYTSDSSICRAAAHEGRSGVVTIKGQGKRYGFYGRTENGIKTKNYHGLYMAYGFVKNSYV